MTTFLHPLRCYTYQQRLTRKSEFLYTWSSEWSSGAVSRHLFKVCKHAEKKPQAQLHKHKEVKNGWKVHGLFCHHSRQLAVCQENAVSHDFTAYSMTSLAPVTVITWREKYLKSAVSWVLQKIMSAFFLFFWVYLMLLGSILFRQEVMLENVNLYDPPRLWWGRRDACFCSLSVFHTVTGLIVGMSRLFPRLRYLQMDDLEQLVQKQ